MPFAALREFARALFEVGLSEPLALFSHQRGQLGGNRHALVVGQVSALKVCADDVGDRVEQRGFGGIVDFGRNVVGPSLVNQLQCGEPVAAV